MSFEQEIKTNKFDNEIHKAHLNVVFTAGWLKSRILQRLKTFGVTHEQFNVLRILRGQYPNAVCMMDIASRMLDRNSNVTRIVEKLLQKNFVVRTKSETDKREVRIEINADGLDLLAKVDSSFKEKNPHICAMTEAEAVLLNALLDKMRDVEE